MGKIFIDLAKINPVQQQTSTAQSLVTAVHDAVQGGSSEPQCVDVNDPTQPGRTLQDLIAQTHGALVIAMPNMKCTHAVLDAMQQRGVQPKVVDFQGPFQYASGHSAIWDYLHCAYPDDKQGTTTMHSYAFMDGQFQGQGFAAAQLVQ